MDRREQYDDPEESLRMAMDGALSQVWTALPAVVTAVNMTAQTVSCQPMIKGTQTAKDGTQSQVSLPLLVDVPICWPKAAGFAVTLPVEAGDEVLVVFASRCIDAWWQSGSEGKAVEDRMHDLSDGFAIFAPTSQAKKLANVQTDGIEIRNEARTTYFKVTETDIYAKCGTMYLDGILNHTGNTTHVGDTTQTGSQTSSGTITGTTDVKGGASNISLKNHGHFALDNVTPLTGKPMP